MPLSTPSLRRSQARSLGRHGSTAPRRTLTQFSGRFPDRRAVDIGGGGPPLAAGVADWVEAVDPIIRSLAAHRRRSELRDELACPASRKIAAIPWSMPQADTMNDVIAVPADLHDSALYFNRELSWLEFNDRVLQEAVDPGAPLLERTLARVRGPAAGHC